ncbi:MAG: hypothetical protein K8J31_13605, partial [Anaerolineae bacterium]|nr:hypothetical protein [Anaerolineae bacterium]
MRVVRNILIVIVLAAIAVVVIQGVLSSNGVTAQETGQNSLIQDETLVDVSSLDVTVSATGSIAPAQQVTLGFELSTLPVTEVLVQEG